MSRPSALLAAALLLSQAALAAQPIYQHSFDQADGWPDSDVNGDLSAVYTVVGGEYLINPLQNMRYALAQAPAQSPSADMIVESDVRMAASQAASRAGIACRVGADHTFYAFAIIASGAYEIVHVRGAQGEVLRTGAIDFDPAAGTRLKAVCQGSTLRFYADGTLLGEVGDATLQGQGAGLLSVSPVVAATNAAFDNFLLQRAGD